MFQYYTGRTECSPLEVLRMKTPRCNYFLPTLVHGIRDVDNSITGFWSRRSPMMSLLPYYLHSTARTSFLLSFGSSGRSAWIQSALESGSRIVHSLDQTIQVPALSIRILRRATTLCCVLVTAGFPNQVQSVEDSITGFWSRRSPMMSLLPYYLHSTARTRFLLSFGSSGRSAWIQSALETGSRIDHGLDHTNQAPALPIQSQTKCDCKCRWFNH